MRIQTMIKTSTMSMKLSTNLKKLQMRSADETAQKSSGDGGDNSSSESEIENNLILDHTVATLSGDDSFDVFDSDETFMKDVTRIQNR